MWQLLKVDNFKGLIVESQMATIQRMAKELQGKMGIMWLTIWDLQSG